MNLWIVTAGLWAAATGIHIARGEWNAVMATGSCVFMALVLASK